MIIKHNTLATANALATVTVIFYVVCRVAASLFPGLTYSITQSWFHGFELTKLGSWNLSLETFVVGLISSAVFAWIIGYVFATAYNYFNKK